jgi:hypothetical protein
MNCHGRNCPDCNDRLIHLTNRGHDESSSPIGQHVHDNLPNTFFWMDSDATVYKMRTRIWRQVEHKFYGQELSKSQETMLPTMARMVASEVAAGNLDDASGVFVLWSDPQFTNATVSRVIPAATLALGSAVYLDSERMDAFLSGQPTFGIPFGQGVTR